MTITSEELNHLLSSDLKDQGLPFDGILAPEASAMEAAAVSITKSLTKKWSSESTEKADAAALAKFLAANTKCKEWALPGVDQIDSRTEMLLNHFKDVANSFWFQDGCALVDHPFDVLLAGRVGPGSNIGARGESFYAKMFASPLTCTSEWLYNWYRRYTDKFPYWNEAEMLRSENYGGPRVVAGSRLSFVPKNVEISRCICTEPTLNTYFQLGFGIHLERRLRERFGIALQTQQFVNRDLARLGSITDGLVTLDLSSASDSISTKMLEWALPPDFVGWLKRLRCDYVEVPQMGTVELHMVSSMGNGFTFPLETMIFSAVVVAAMKFRGIPEHKSQSSELWSVFGDDIICPSACAGDVIHLLTLLGFSVNDDKSFVEGPFRESCGSDFYKGAPVRGVYLKSLESMPSRFAAINQLIRFSTMTGIVLPKLIGRLLLTVKFLPIPRWANVDSGIQVQKVFAQHLPRHRYFQSQVYTCLEPIAKVLRFEDGNVVVPARHKSLIYNPSGLYISVLQGGVSSWRLPVRSDRVKYQAKRRISPNWDWYAPSGRDHSDYGLDWRRWESVVSDLLERVAEIPQ